jgi:hypothetical protein
MGTLGLAGERSTLPERLTSQLSTGGLPGLGGKSRLPDIQFDISAFIGHARTFNDGAGDVLALLPPVHTVFTTAKLNRTPRPADQRMLREALKTIEGAYPFAADGILTFVSYGLPYFDRLPARLVAAHMPRLITDDTRFALEEAMPGPTDVSPQNPGVTKQTFNILVRIEQNDLLITIRSDNASHIHDVLSWLGGSDSLRGLPIRFASPFRRAGHGHVEPGAFHP